MSLTASELAAQLAARASAVIPGGVNSGQRRVPGLEDLVVTATSGATFTDANGVTYTDYHSAFGPPLLGHNDPDVDGAVAAAGRSVDLMGVGVTPVEIELAERLVDVVPSLEKVLLTATGSEATFHALRLARTVTGRRHVLKFQGCYHGWHDAVAMNVISPAEKVGTKDLLSGGILPEVADATIVVPFNDAAAVERALTDHDVAAIIIEPIPHNIGAVLPQPGFLERLRELATAHGTVLVFDEVITGFRHGLGGYQADRGRHAGSDHAREGDGERLARLGARRQGRADGSLLDHPGPARVLRGHVQRPPGDGGGGSRHRRQAPAGARARARLPAGRAGAHRARSALRTARRPGRRERLRLGVRHVLPRGPGRLVRRPPANDVDLFVGYRRELMKEGIFELPLNLKRSHFSYAHTDEDVDRLLEGTEAAVTRFLDARA